MDKTLSNEELDIMQALRASRLHLIKACKATPSGSTHVLVRANQVQKLLDNLTAAEQALRAPRWISVSEALPECNNIHPQTGCQISSIVLVVQDGQVLDDFHYLRDKQWFGWLKGSFDTYGITHWQYLPQAPKKVSTTSNLPV